MRSLLELLHLSLLQEQVTTLVFVTQLHTAAAHAAWLPGWSLCESAARGTSGSLPSSTIKASLPVPVLLQAQHTPSVLSQGSNGGGCQPAAGRRCSPWSAEPCTMHLASSMPKHACLHTALCCCRLSTPPAACHKAAGEVAVYLLLADAAVLGLLSPGALPEPELPDGLPGSWGSGFLQDVREHFDEWHCLPALWQVRC